MTHEKFKKLIWDYYAANKRIFPWRTTTDPYAILVSEIMLQQTQTERVIPKYTAWLEVFPTAEVLAKAPLQQVLTYWQGLGYNRRALALQRAAQTVVQKYSKKFPTTYAELLDLPGIGPYTAGAVLAFAFNKAHPIIETNIRTVYIHEFFSKEHGEIHDSEILELVRKTLDQKNPRDWYYALMDYGVMLKKAHGNANKRSKHYTKQSKFIGSNRQIRAAIVRAITKSPQTEKSLIKQLELENISTTPEIIDKNLLKLCDEGFIVKQGQKFGIL
ncbi:MAG: A/G-specific adenine glycosylase [Patescibacteria group bacterium]